MAWTLDDFDYLLPPELIAQAPLARRTDSRLLQVSPQLADLQFSDLPRLLAPGDLLVFNDTRVIHARLFGAKASGGQVEVMIERPLGPHEALAQIRASKSPKPGTWLRLEDALDVEVIGRAGGPFDVGRQGQAPVALEQRDEVFARNPGSVAAPTAGLHFDEALLARLAEHGVNSAYITLNVGAGTFQPVRVHDLSEHKMHTEAYFVPQATVDAIAATKAAGRRVVCVGTTSMRALESAAHGGELEAGEAESDLFILPGYRFRVADALITNFHLPKSTLLMLVSALAGVDVIRGAYAHAVAARYRFFSYGDAMFLTRNPA